MEFKITEHNSIQYGYKNHAYEIYKPKVGNQNYSALKKLFLTCESALSNYSKVCVIRADLHPATYSPENKLIRQFLKLQVQKFKSLKSVINVMFDSSVQESKCLPIKNITILLYFLVAIKLITPRKFYLKCNRLGILSAKVR